MTALPIEPVLPELGKAIRDHGQAVLQAPPGAGKTTRVPLYLLEQGLIDGRILMLEPRRLAARAAAERMAQMTGTSVGDLIGYRMRGDTKVSPNTRMEVITEGILTRMIQTDPELSGVGCILFDEFHERSLQGDLGLALALEVRGALRPDLCLIPMSATLDAEPVAALLGDAPLITSEGRSFEVETRHLPRPWRDPKGRARFGQMERAFADLICQATKESEGSMLAFLPGAPEIGRVQAALGKRLGSIDILPLYGAMRFADQRRAIAPAAKDARKLVLATSIAETSLTIEGITCVIDSGLTRRARHDPGSGMSRLVTERVSKAEATQRTGRAGRLAPGTCYKFWTAGEDGGLRPFAPAEITDADLTSLVLELAAWGTSDPGDLPFLDPPNPAAFKAAQELLQSLDALDADGRITSHGRAIAAHPVHARLGHMLEGGGADAALLAAVLDNRDILQSARGAAHSALDKRLSAVRDPAKFAKDTGLRIDASAAKRIRADAKRLRTKDGKAGLSTAQLAALAYPDRIGLRRPGDAPRYILSGGKGAVFAPDDPMGVSRLIVALDLDGDRREARIRLATQMTEADLRALWPERILDEPVCHWSHREQTVIARQQTRFGALVLAEQKWPECPADQLGAAMLDGIRDLGLDILPWDKAARLLQARIEWLRARGSDMPDCSDEGLLARMEHWLSPFLNGARRPADLARLSMGDLTAGWLDWDQKQTLDRLAPARITAPTGTGLKVDYSGAQPKVSVRLQELFGMTQHPTLGPDRIPVLLELLSPAQRPVQTTADLPGFWASSYTDVRRDMRGRYPRHPWPEDPTQAAPTRRAKPRGQ